MTTAPRPRKPPESAADIPRRAYASRAIGALLPAVTRAAFRSQGAALAVLLADWPLIVGPALGQATVPRRCAAGTLTLGCSGPMALELQHLAGPLIERINTHVGRAAVQRLRFVQEARPLPAAPGGTSSLRAPRPPTPIAGLPDGPLRDALGRLGAALGVDRA